MMSLGVSQVSLQIGGHGINLIAEAPIYGIKLALLKIAAFLLFSGSAQQPALR